jgi:hypothetical protein
MTMLVDTSVWSLASILVSSALIAGAKVLNHAHTARAFLIYSAATGTAPVAAGRFTRKHSGISARHSQPDR